ncbi:hypothetical protein S3E15_05978 [Bacillus mycoides]|uniref:Uncharacterized protein n=1 Tax=Bacillus mycoides TaxID=1405 RepID=A0AAP8BDT6_BACMY|nr:hypothetical protein S3E15_05978 [Bacillus mycoides]
MGEHLICIARKKEMNYNLNITNIPNLKSNKPLSREAEGPVL